ncbi:MAG: SPFH domain-containing protein [Planctomycetota bacterium]|jgi:regulator of protease activity HflC (stomatin/prohibitin superfamily)
MRKTLTLISVGLVLLFLASGLLMERVGPYQIGVKQNQLAGGIAEQDYDTGYHLGVAFVHKWYKLDRRVHVLSFSEEAVTNSGKLFRYEGFLPTGMPPMSDLAGSLELRTGDGNTVALDVTVTYRIKEDQAWKIVRDGLQASYRARVRDSIRGLLLEQLAGLTPESLIDTELRLKRAEESLPKIRDAVAQYHVEPESLLIRAVRFPTAYEQKLQDKQLTRQKALLADAKQKQEKQRQITEAYEKETEAQEKRLEGEWNVRLQELLSDNQVAIAQIDADAQIYDRRVRAGAEADYVTMLAEGQLAIDRAEALRNQLRNAALDTTGGRILLAQQAAQNLEIEEVTLNSNDPNVPTVLDLGELVELLVGAQP